MTPRVDPTQALAEERAGLLVWRTLLFACALAFIGVVLPVRFGKPLEIAAIAIVTAIPLVRVMWLIKRWSVLRDMKYVWWAVVLLVLVAVGPVIALLGG
jgi:hypothetical protein